MADRKISQYPSQATPLGTDEMVLNDPTDTTQAPSGTNKKSTRTQMVAYTVANAGLTNEYIVFGGSTGNFDQEIGLRYKKSVRAFTTGSSTNISTGNNAVVIGGNENQATAGNCIAGGLNARAIHTATAIFHYTTNPSDPVFSSTTTGTWCLRTESGIGIETNAPNSQFHTDCNWAVGRSASATSTNTATEVIIGITDTSSPRTVTLQTADTVEGRIYIIKDESGAAGTNNITIDTQGSETIDGASSITITVDYGVARVYSDGSNWFTF